MRSIRCDDLFSITNYHEAKIHNPRTATLRVRRDARSDASRDGVESLRAALHGGVQEMHPKMAAQRIDKTPCDL